MYQLRLLAGNLHHLLGIEFFKHLINSRARVPTYTYLNHRVIAEPGLEASWWVHSLRTSSTALLKHLTYRHNPKLRPEQHTPQFPSVFLCQSHNSNTRIRHLLSWPPYKPTSTLSVRGSPRKVLFNYTSRPKKSYYKENQIKWEKKNRMTSSPVELEMLRSNAFNEICKLICSAFPTGHTAPYLHSSSTFACVPKRHVGDYLFQFTPRRASFGNIKSFERN